MRLLLLLILFHTSLAAKTSDNHKLLICGVCRNSSQTAENSIKNIEQLGSSFADYAVVIYENNSSDNTAALFADWANRNSHVVFLSETLKPAALSCCRTQRMANARNKVLREIRKKKYDGFKFLVMVDLDFKTAWPIQEIVDTINLGFHWDAIFANGVRGDGKYFDRLAFRSRDYPFGPELLNHHFWIEMEKSWFTLTYEWLPVYSAFGGLAIYKTKTLRQFTYSGTVTKALKEYYKKILASLPDDNPHLQLYRKFYRKHPFGDGITFQKNCLEWQSPDDDAISVCEHVALHAAMARKGYSQFFINPKLIMRY